MANFRPISIPRDILLSVYREAREAFPAECCGWLRGPRGGHAIAEVDGLRACYNAQESAEHSVQAAADRSAETAYVIAGNDLLELHRDYDRSETPPLVIYHSHPNGRAYFSATDQLAAAPLGEPSYAVQHLVVGITAETVTEAALFDWCEESETFVEIARFDGADI